MEDLISKDLTAQKAPYAGTENQSAAGAPHLLSSETPYATRLELVENHLKSEIGRLGEAVRQLQDSLKEQGRDLSLLKQQLAGPDKAD